MIESLTHIANAQAQLGNLHLTLISEQETPLSLEKAARMARSLEETAAALRAHLRQWADDMRIDQFTTELIASVPYPDAPDE